MALVLAFAVAGCAALTGIDALEKVECAEGCDASVLADGAATGDAAAEGAAGREASVDTACGPTNTITNCGACGNACDGTNSLGAFCNGSSCVYAGCRDGYADCDTASPNINGCETPIRSVIDCGACGNRCDTANSLGASCDGTKCVYTGCRAGFVDCDGAAPNTNGCESSTRSLTSCGGCGNACDTATSSARTCDGTRCGYTCLGGRSSCNSVAPDTGGCECVTPGCCGAACQSAHANGLGRSFYDCAPLGTYNATQAMAACVAFTGNASQCNTLRCQAGGYDLICSTTSPVACACWDYGGSAAGRVHNTGMTGLSNCWCPETIDPQWN